MLNYLQQTESDLGSKVEMSRDGVEEAGFGDCRRVYFHGLRQLGSSTEQPCRFVSNRREER
jgi:hypothetical protein